MSHNSNDKGYGPPLGERFNDSLAQTTDGPHLIKGAPNAMHPPPLTHDRAAPLVWTQTDVSLSERPPEPPAAHPDAIGRYRVLGLLGAGGMGEVLFGHDPLLDRPVAMKRVRAERRRDAERWLRFQREATLNARLSHPNVVRVYDYLQEADGDHIITEYVEGESLHDLLRRDELDMERAVEIVLHIARGLTVAHANGVVHCDLKSENILIGRDDAVKITDFGISHAADHDSMTEVRGLTGTVRAMSPEQSRCEPTDFRSDLFSFGVLIYEIFGRKSPFLGRDANDTLHRVRTEKHRPLRELAPRVPLELSILVDQLLEKPRERRPASTADVEAALARIQRQVRPRPDAAATATSIIRRQVAVVYLRAARGHGDLETRARSLAAFHDRVERHALHLGATVVSGVDAEALVCVGYPRTHENNCERAAFLVSEVFGALDPSGGHADAAALDAGDLWLVDRPGRPLLAGAVLAASPALGRDVPDGTFVASARAQRLLARFFKLEPIPSGTDTHELAYRVCGSINRDAGGLHERTPFVGRAEELACLRGWLEQVVGDRSRRTVALRGEGGIGKSRLLQAFLASVADLDLRCISLSATPATQHTALGPMRELCQRLPELADEAGKVTRASVGAMLGRFETRRPEWESVLAVFLDCGNAEDEALLGKRSGDDNSVSLATVLCRLIESLAETNPLLLALEDVHWLDHASRRVIEQLGAEARPVPLMLVLTCRPDGIPDLAAERSHVLPIVELRPSDAERIVATYVGERRIQARTLELVLQRAEGNPLLLEELAAAALDHGQDLSAGIDERPLPLTLRDSVAARMQNFAPPTRYVAELAATCGKEFEPRLLAAAGGLTLGEILTHLEALERVGLLERRGFLQDQVYAFRHGLIREALYASVAKADRLGLHAAALDAYESAFPEVCAKHPEVLAEHAEFGGRLSRAIDYAFQAGQLAARRFAHRIACEHFERALRLLEVRYPNDRERALKVRRIYAVSLAAAEGWGARAVERNNAIVQRLSSDSVDEPKWTELWQQWTFAYVTADMPRLTAAMGLMQGVLETTQSPESPIIRYLLTIGRGAVYLQLGLLADADVELKAALGLRPALMDVLRTFPLQEPTVIPGVYLAWSPALRGDKAESIRLMLAEEASHPEGSVAYLCARSFNVHLFHLLGADDEAEERAAEIVKVGGDLLAPPHIHSSALVLDAIKISRLAGPDASPDDVTALIRSMRHHDALWTCAGMRTTALVYKASMARSCLALARKVGREDLSWIALAEGREILDEALVLGTQGNELDAYMAPEVLQLDAQWRFVRGDAEGGRGALQQSRERALKFHLGDDADTSLYVRRIAEVERAFG